jgi:hypothetical protein
MRHLLLWVGRASGVAGIVICAIALFARIRSDYYVASIQVGTLFQLGIAAMVLACLSLLLVITANMTGRH